MITQSGRGSSASRRASASARAAAGWAARGPRVRWRSLRWAIRMRLKVARPPGNMAPMIGRLHHLIIDSRDPLGLAAFYSGLLGQPITYRSDDFVVVSDDDTTSGLAFQLAPDHQPPAWPGPAPAATDAPGRDGGGRGRSWASRTGPGRDQAGRPRRLRRPGRASVLPDP